MELLHAPNPALRGKLYELNKRNEGIVKNRRKSSGTFRPHPAYENSIR